MKPSCNICGGDEFVVYRGRAAEQCTQCGSKARHRIGWDVYATHLLPMMKQRPKGKVLHLAPEAALHDLLSDELGAGYMPADAAPERYPHAQCLKLFFPDDFTIFPDGYFDAILHNHVLEHIPGHYGDHLRAFTRLLSPGGKMIFSIPGPYLDRETIEGGEHLSSDAERLEAFLQEDHFKLIGSDFPGTLTSLVGGAVLEDGITDARRAQLSVRPGKAPFFIWQRDG
ncbi:class I SAM-dependent methyltransferase [Pseudahrensia aquimaris]|uniref:Class I SAM-dependent methyltransferase n=1 Tax=Pseudahrensia aquimaris TaxID=744461 RepID=A0ABW3FLX5_9HYPH